MKNRIGLIQLLGEETIPCLLPMLSFRPAAVTHVASHGFEGHAEQVLRAAELAHAAPPPQERLVIGLSNMPSMTETHHAVSEAIAAFQRRGIRPVINFTGGTKLMSIGAFKAASAEAVTSLYVDGDRGFFCDGQTGPDLLALVQGGLDLRPLGEKLSVKLLAVANGCEMKGHGCRFHELLPLSRHLLAHPEDEQAAWKATHAHGGVFAEIERRRDPKAWARVPEIEFPLPPAVLDLAVRAGLVETSNGMARICPEDSRDLKALAHGRLSNFDQMRLIGALQIRVNFFGGGWWEVAVAGAVEDSGKFRDVLWSARLAKEGQRTLEEDVLAVQDINLAYFSCKRGNPLRLMRQLEETDASARRLGGRMTRKYFCACHLDGRIGDDLRRRAKQLHVHLVSAADIDDFPAFLKTVSDGNPGELEPLPAAHPEPHAGADDAAQSPGLPVR